MGDGCLFGDKLIATFAKALEVNATAKKEGRNIHGEYCIKYFSCTSRCSQSMFGAICDAKLPIRCILDVDWTTILEFQPVSTVDAWRTFDIFHILADQVIVNDPSSVDAKQFLQKLGASKKLFQQALEWVICGNNAEAPRSRKDFLIFFHRFVRCLIPVPSDNKTTKLIRRARSVLKQFDNSTDGSLCTTIALMEQKRWKELQRFTDEECFQFHREFDIDDIESDVVKIVRRRQRERLQQESERMCAKCFTLEKDLAPGKKMEHCSRCLGICYCCRTCQVEDWIVHKTYCKRVTVAK